MACQELGLTYGEWAGLSKKERTRWIAFLTVRGQVETFQQFEDDLETISVGLGDWLDYDDDTREMKLDFAEQAEG